MADKLKSGQAVDPENYDSVTVLFSDVVSFTTIASRSTPMQIVYLLNELYTLFDDVIAEFDVYKASNKCLVDCPTHLWTSHMDCIA